MVVLWCEKCGQAFESATIATRYCSKQCLKAAKEDVVQCRVCGKAMYDPPRRARPPEYCSRECAYRARLEQNRANWWRARGRQKLPPQTRTCETCGAEFETDRAWQRFCSEKCRAKAERERRKARRAAEAAAMASAWMECARCHDAFDPADADARPPYCSERCERLARRSREMAAATKKAHAANVARHKAFVRAEAAAKAPADWEW